MRTRLLLAAVPLLLSGCLSPVTQRLDRTNVQLEGVNQHLVTVPPRVEERHPAGRQFFVTAYGVQMALPADRLQRAAAGTLAQHRLVAEREIQQDQRRGAADR